MLGKIESKKEKRATEDEMVGWHYQLNGHESEQAPGDSERQGSWHAAVHGEIVKDREAGMLQSMELQSQTRLSD